MKSFEERLPESKAQLALKLRALVLASDERLEERFSYKTPFYYFKKRVFLYELRRETSETGSRILFWR